MLNRVITIVGFKIEDKNQNLMLEIGDHVPEYVIADHQRLAQVITNFLSNANKFTPKDGTIWLRVNHLTTKDGVCRLRLEVQDDGIGISEEQQQRLFRSFEQVDNSISRKYGGTGLGLIISKRIIEMMNGKVWIESELNQGANFIFEIDVRIRADLKDKLPSDIAATTAAGEESLNGIFAGKHILLAEDVEVNRMIVLSLLEPTQAEIDCVENGAEAVCKFKESPDKYDIIFMDIQMPLMDGYEATRKIRSLYVANAATIPIVAMTANVFRDEVEKCLTAGMNSHIGKPLDFNELLKELRNWL
jgi:CheY-like chemotaxis protein